VGVIGARFGGTVAALVAERAGLDALASWDPIVSGDSYARELLRRQAISGFVRNSEESGSAGVKRLRRELETAGSIAIEGFDLSSDAFDELTRVDLVRDVTTFGGSSLVGGVSRSGSAGPRLLGLAEHLRSLSGRCRVEVVQDAAASEFGRFHYRIVPGTFARRDSLRPIAEAIAMRTVAWARSLVDASDVEGLGRPSVNAAAGSRE